MKNVHKKAILVIFASIFAFGTSSVYAQDLLSDGNETTTSSIDIDMGVDVMSSFIRRGLKYGNGAAIQSFVELTSNNFTLGAWNNISTGSNEAFEINLYTTYEFPFGVTIGVKDYFGNGNVFGTNFENLGKTHSLEPSLAYKYGELTFFGALMFYQNKAGEAAQDFYGEISYAFDLFDLAIGAGNGRYVTSPQWGTVGEFAICNLTISKEKTIKITDSFSFPMKGAITLNPYNERFYAYVGISL